MKKNMLTILLVALAVVNVTLSAVLVFIVVPSAMKTNQLVIKVMQILDLELESTVPEEEISIDDIDVYTMEDEITVNLGRAANDAKNHYALFKVSLSMNKKDSDYESKKDSVKNYETFIREIITDEFAKYTVDTVISNKDTIKKTIIAEIADLFQSNFIINISFGNIIVE